MALTKSIDHNILYHFNQSEIHLSLTKHFIDRPQLFSFSQATVYGKIKNQ
jgi:hypothetical protein